MPQTIISPLRLRNTEEKNEIRNVELVIVQACSSGGDLEQSVLYNSYNFRNMTAWWTQKKLNLGQVYWLVDGCNVIHTL